MNSEKWKVEDRGKSSATPEELGVLYRRAFDGLRDWEIPPDMTDRIMEGLTAEMGSLPDVNPDVADAVKRERFLLIREQVVDLADRGKVILAGFGRYTASIAACFVLALGLFTMNSPAGQQIIGIGTEKGNSVTSEAPVKADAGKENLRQKETRSSSSNAGNQRSEPAGTERSQSLPETEQAAKTPGVSATENVGSSELQNPTPSNVSAPKKKTTSLSGNTQNAGGSASNPSSENNTSQSNNTEDHSSRRSVGTGTVTEENPPQIVEESPSVENDISTSEPVREIPVGEENPVNPSSTEEDQVVAPEPNLSEQKKPFIFDSTHPVKELAGVEELEETMGYQPALPENLPDGWKTSSVEVIWGVTAQIVYNNESNSVLYRTSAGVSSISSESGTYPVVIESEIYKLEGDDADHIKLITWSSGDFSYSMAFDEAVSEQEALIWAKSVNHSDVQEHLADQ